VYTDKNLSTDKLLTEAAPKTAQKRPDRGRLPLFLIRQNTYLWVWIFEWPAGEPQRHGRKTMGIGNIGLPGILLIAIVVLVLFGRGKISGLMGEVGKGITSFKKGISEGQAEIEDEKAETAKDVTPEDEKDKV
jgi:sec-independent protein translocase protein TatA